MFELLQKFIDECEVLTNQKPISMILPQRMFDTIAAYLYPRSAERNIGWPISLMTINGVELQKGKV